MNIISDSISISTTEALWFLSQEWIDIVVQSAVKNEKVYSATLYNHDNKQVAHNQKTQLSTNTHKIIVPLIKQNEEIGTLSLVFDMDEMGELGKSMDKTRLSLKKMFHKLEAKVIYDNLTKVYNRYGFETLFNNEIKRSSRYNRPLSLIMFDIDFFKKVNDSHGHLVGDKVLVTIC